MGGQHNLRRLTATILFVALIACGTFTQAASPKRVLLVYQGEGAGPADRVFEQSLVKSLRAAMGPGVEFYREQLDSSRFPDRKQHKITELHSQYADRKIDVVVFSASTLCE